MNSDLYRRPTFLLRSLGAFLCAALLVSSGCSEDVTPEDNNASGCPDGEVENPITGLCQSTGTPNNMTSGNNSNTCPGGGVVNPVTGMCPPVNPNNTSTNNTSTNNNSTTPENNTSPANNSTTPTNNTSPDMGMDMPVEMCSPDADTDGDGLTDKCECDWGGMLDPTNPDTDGDGLTDGEEDADADCGISNGETDPRQADTDADGIDDGDEIANNTNPLTSDTDGDGLTDGVEINGCTDPNNVDSDMDGIEDGTEDGNADGEIGVCPMRVYDPMCAAGESDPCKADTDGNGTPDADEVIYRTCRPSDLTNLVQPPLIINMSGDYQLAINNTATPADVTSMTVTGLNAHVFEDPSNAYTGFVVALQPPAGQEEATQLADHVFTEVLAEYPMSSRRSAGRQITTHDNFKAVVAGVVDLPAGTSPEAARDAVLARLTGAADLTHSLTSTIPVGAMEPTLFHYEVIARSMTEYILVGAFAPLTSVQDDALETGFRVDDLVNGTSVAGSMETLEADCVSYKVIERPQVDIIISMDASGSMSDEQMALANFVGDLTGFLDAANLDWRIGVTSVACSNIADDMALSEDFRALFPMSMGGGGGGFPFPFPGDGPCQVPFNMGTSNGTLVARAGRPGFTNVVDDIRWRINNVDGTNSEYTFAMGAAAVDRALPRAANAPDKIRENAAVIVIVVTDEEDEFFKETLDFLPKENPDPNERMLLEMETAPWVDYLLRPEVGATVFGLYNVPNSDCASAAQFGTAIHDVVNKTGGTGGSICQSDITTSLQTIASATAGIASGLRLRGSPVPPSIIVKHAQVMSGMEVEVTRNRANGYDYDGIVNRIAFFGSALPQTNDRVVMPYLRWKNSVFMCMDESDCPAEQKFKCVDGECR